MMIRYPERYRELWKKVHQYYVPVWNDDHTEILGFELDPDAPEEIKKDYEELKYIEKYRMRILMREDRKKGLKTKGKCIN